MLRALGVFVVSCFLAGCTDDSSLLTVTAIPTLLTVDPLRFRGNVRCGAPELQSYVVALSRVSPPETLVAVSVPAACTTPTSFGSPPVEIGAFYTAVIDGYDRADLTPAAPSSREMHDPEGNIIRPRWTTTCGLASSSDDGSAGNLDASVTDASPPTPTADNRLITPTQALLSTEVFLHGCLPLRAAPQVDASTPDDAAGGELDAADEAEDEASDGGAGDASLQPTDATDDAAKSPTGDARPNDG
jgi:hypothetical protein